jgi:sodium-coupled neutral amino acid transporter 11
MGKVQAPENELSGLSTYEGDPVEHLLGSSSDSDDADDNAAAAAPLGKDPDLAPLISTPTTPRTPNRVRFQLDDNVIDSASPNASRQASRATRGGRFSEEQAGWMEEEDYLTSHAGNGRRDSDSHRAPLLTDLEAPSVTLANSDFVAEDHLESARPKSGLKMAFMNMANSIIGAGIIGQPYAFRQAGLLTGVILLVALTITVDWTINLIVINSKLSGANSFQATVEACFGRPGLIAISLAQWAL